MKPMDAEFAEYVRARQHGLLRAAYLVCGDRHQAEDLVQQALIKLALRWEKIRTEHPDAFVRRVLYRDAVSSWRRTRRERPTLDPAGSSPYAAHDEHVEAKVDLERALSRLAPGQRAVLVLRFFEDRSEAETAAILGVSVGTVKSQTHDALSRIRTLVPHLAPLVPGGEPS